MQIEGTLKVINPEKQISATFKTREFVVTSDSSYPQHILIQLTQDKCEYLDGYSVGEQVKVSININGKEWQNQTTGEIKYFNSISAWRIERVQGHQTQGPPPAPADEYAPPIGNPSSFEEDSSDLPFN